MIPSIFDLECYLEFNIDFILAMSMLKDDYCIQVKTN